MQVFSRFPTIMAISCLLTIGYSCHEKPAVSKPLSSKSAPPLNEFRKVDAKDLKGTAGTPSTQSQQVVSVPSEEAKSQISKDTPETKTAHVNSTDHKQENGVKAEILSSTKKQVASASPANKPKSKKSIKPKKSKRVYANIQWDNPVYDFGEITEGDVIEHSFTFTNTGKVPLEIKSAEASCGCTRPSFPFINIEPGQSNKIVVSYHSVSKSGEQHPEVVIVANTYPDTMVLKLHGFVKPKEKEAEDQTSHADSTDSGTESTTDTPAKNTPKGKLIKAIPATGIESDTIK